MGDEGINTEAAAAGNENEDLGATGATEENSTSIVEEDEIAEEEGKNAEAATEDEVNNSLGTTGDADATELATILITVHKNRVEEAEAFFNTTTTILTESTNKFKQVKA